MRKTKGNKGITLIALVITIIVMLILVAVTINMAVNGGLFGYAGNAVSDTEKAKQDEQNWTKLKDGMTTNQLIAKFTGDTRAEDIMKLKQFIETIIEERIIIDMNIGKPFPHGIEPIPDADESIEVIGLGDEGIIIQYNNHKYFIDDNDPDDVDVREATYIDIARITHTMVTINAFLSETFEFALKESETWYSWATDNEYDDINIKGDLNNMENGPTLKEAILEKHNGEDKRISVWRDYPKTGGRYTYYLKYNNEYVLTTDDIVPGGTYNFSR